MNIITRILSAKCLLICNW